MKTLTIEQVQLEAIKQHINQFADSELVGLCRNMRGNAQLKYAAAHGMERNAHQKPENRQSAIGILCLNHEKPRFRAGFG